MGVFAMPSLGADMEAGTLVEWLVGAGEEVARGDIVAVVETEKGAIEIEIFETGQIEALLVEPGALVPVGTPLARLAEAGVPAGRAPELEAPAPIALRVEVPSTPRVHGPLAPPMRDGEGARPLASPAARRLAAERGISLARLAGSGPGGAILSSDLPEAGGAEKPPPEPNLAPMRRAIAAAMARSKREIPHYYLHHRIDLGTARAWLERTNAERAPPGRLLMAALFLKACALALRRFPEFNGFYTESGFEPSGSVHLGVGIAIRGGGLIAPAMHDADRLDLDSLMADLRDKTQRMRAGRVRSSELSDPTATVSSLGDRGVEALFGVIYPPQVALIGFGKVSDRPAVVDGQVVPRPLVDVSLSGDHRANDGHRGALLLNEIDKRLQEPESL